MYWAPGAAHGPHQIFKEWAEKYKGKFDDGWDKYRVRTFALIPHSLDKLVDYVPYHKWK
jgi:arylsulfatase A-like enzyme